MGKQLGMKFLLYVLKKYNQVIDEQEQQLEFLVAQAFDTKEKEEESLIVQT